MNDKADGGLLDVAADKIAAKIEQAGAKLAAKIEQQLGQLGRGEQLYWAGWQAGLAPGLALALLLAALVAITERMRR